MHAYLAYGLSIRSELELPELPPGPGAPDVVIQLGAVTDAPALEATGGTVLRATPEEAWLHWRDAGVVRVRQGHEITVDARPDADPRVLRLCLLGPALALLLHQRGLLVLHASAVLLADGAVAFLAESGGGKSTTAAALHARGGRLVADDVAAVDWSAEGRPVVLPGYPQLKLWPDAVRALGQAPDSWPRVHPGEEKRGRRVTDMDAAPTTLRRLYCLTDAASLGLEPLRGHAAAFELLQHSYVAPALRHLGSSAHLARCARLAAVVPVRRLCRPRTLDGLGALAALVEADTAAAEHAEEGSLGHR